MSSRLLHSIGKSCLRHQPVGLLGVPLCSAAFEPLAKQLNSIARCFATYNPTSLAQSSLHDQCNQSVACSPQSHASLSWHARQLTNIKGFTSFSSRSQAADVQSSGINPLMQTPAPAARGSVFVPPLAAAVQQDRTAQAVLRKTKISPKKLNEFARLIRRMHIDDALVQCQVAPNKAAKLCYKLLLSAKDNAEKDKGLDPEKLRIDRAFVGKGQHSKRMNTHARGRSGVRHVYRSHLTIILTEGKLKRVTRFRPPNAQWNKHKRSVAASVA